MKDHVKVVGQVALGIIAGSVASKGMDVVIDKVKKVVKAKNEKSRN